MTTASDRRIDPTSACTNASCASLISRSPFAPCAIRLVWPLETASKSLSDDALDAPPISSSSRLENAPWNRAPVTATPSEPPTMRPIDRIPDATPALVTSTEFIAAVDIGDIVSAMPMPSRTNAGSSVP